MSGQQSERLRRRPRPRLESLSDLIYGLSLSIGAISLVITNGQTLTISDIDRNILDFVFVFMILITSWIIYTSDMSVLPIETRLITFLNVVLLVLVAITPYLFDQVTSPAATFDVQNYSSILFTLDYAATLLIMTIFSHVIAQEERQLVDGEIMESFRRGRNRLLLLMIVVLLSLGAPWDWLVVGVHVRLLVWAVPIALYWFNRMRRGPVGVSGVGRPS